jgi:hypothetical protein
MQVSGPYGNGSAAAVAGAPRAPRAARIATESVADLYWFAQLRDVFILLLYDWIRRFFGARRTRSGQARNACLRGLWNSWQ